MLFSVIIPLKELNAYVDQNIKEIMSQNFSSLEVLIIPNEMQEDNWPQLENLKIIASGRVSPGEKRDLGAKFAKGKYLVFLDDDSFPYPGYFDCAERLIQGHQDLIALGGPGITPTNNSAIQQASGAFFTLKVGGGFPERYLPYGQPKFVDDWPSVNLIVRTDIFLEIGGFDTDYWPGEDSHFCDKLTGKYPKSILYQPDLKVAHHRRGGWLAHLKQVGNYGLFRGHLFRQRRKNSFKPTFIIPSLFLTLLVFTTVNLLIAGTVPIPVTILLCIYAVIVLASALQACVRFGWLVGLLTLLFITPSHIWYGFRFVLGTLTPVLVSKLR
jgi:glycosyltransferase involved in cell wall biosynthesis